MSDMAHVTHVEYPGPYTRNPYSDSSYLNIFFRLPTSSTFQILTYTEAQYHGAGGRPIGSLTIRHTYIPSMTITIIDMEP